MKRILLALSLLATIHTTQGFSKEKEKDYTEVVVKNANGVSTYEGVVNVENVSKDEMFKRAKQWVMENLKTADNNIGFDEKNLLINNSATVVIDPGHGFNWSITHGLINFKIKVEFRDGRYKFVIDNIIVQAAYADGVVETTSYDKITRNNKPAVFLRTQVNEKLLAIAQSLEQAVKQGNHTSKEDW